MSDALYHRGPDAGGVWVDADLGLALGHRRLAVLELSPHGAQPMVSSDGRYVLSFNGEIYNHSELRLKMQASPGNRPQAWRGHSDTETLVELIALWGFEATLSLLNGMYAFAVWDRRDQILSLAVDRLGEKPLYYGTHAGAFFFASEPVAFKALPGWTSEVDRGALASYLRFGFVPAPHSIFRDVWKLEPGGFLQVRHEVSGGHQMRRGKHWDLVATAHNARANRFSGSAVDAVETLDQHLRRIVGRQMRADVPLGAFLSGGIDSSTVTALMQAQSSVPIQTFTIGFDSKRHDESASARLVAAHLGTHHTELNMDWRAALDLIPRLPEIWSEPFADSSQLPTVLISRLARKTVKVALSGDGGDELFGGYTRHQWAHGPGRRLQAWPSVFKRAAAMGIRSVSSGAWDSVFDRLGQLEKILPSSLRVRLAGEKLHKLAGALGARDDAEFYRSILSQWQSPEEILDVGEPEGWVEASRGWQDVSDPVERMMLLDMLLYLPGDILTKVDRGSMSASLETRLPFLDPELVEFSLGLPLSLKLRGGESKWILRQLLDRYVPPKLIDRPKMGFMVPIGDWLRGPLREWAEALFDPTRLSREGYLSPGPIRRRWEAHLAGKSGHQNALWNVLMFQAWLENNRQG